MGAPIRYLYDHSPVAVLILLCTLAGQWRNWQRYDAQFENRCRCFREASRWSLREAEEYQLGKLRTLLAYCIGNVPFYERRHSALHPSELRKLSDWHNLPALSKDDVRQAGTSLISQQCDARKLLISHSGGSTGMPLRCYHLREALRSVYACVWALQRPGVSRRDKYATFQGLDIVPKTQVAGPYWRMNYAMRQRLYSIFHLSEATIGAYIADLDRYRPVYLAGYANSLYLLAKLAEEQRLRPSHSPKAVFSTSEQLLPAYRTMIERVFRTRVWDAYSQDETCGSITEYECGFYHYDRSYGYMEFHDLERLPGNRRLAEIYCTGFLNPAWPLLRYRPGDLVEYEPAERCPRCGRAGPIIHSIRGRTGDALLLPSGRRFPHISLVVKSLHGVRQVQLVQRSVNRVIIRYVPSEDFKGSADEQLMLKCFAGAVGDSVNWEVEPVAAIPRTAAGKFMSIVNQVSPAPAAGLESGQERNS